VVGLVAGGFVVADVDGDGLVEGEVDGEVEGEVDGEADGDVLGVVGFVVGGLVVGLVPEPPPLLPGMLPKSGPWTGPSTEPYTRVAWNRRVQRTGTSRTSRPVRGASTILPSPAYIATWWMPVQLFVELKKSRSPGSSE
jgi:hypothetical protein